MSDAAFMRRALELAATQVGRTADNPAVGCVLVLDQAVVGEGATADGGRPHAEDLALRAADAKAQRATAYVTLEPCAARSQPDAVSCTDLLIAAGVSRVVVAALDPHPNASGTGIKRLRDAGILVETGVLEAEARAQNADFIARWKG